MKKDLIANKASKIKLLISDVDGVLTDGGIYYSNDGVEMKKFHVRDGQICNNLIEKGIMICAITGRDSKIVERRLSELNFKYIFQGIKDKVKKLNLIIEKENISLKEIAYIGDDINDLDIFKLVGLSAAPSDTLNYIRERVDYVTSVKGGKGAFREFAELILEAKGRDE